MAYALATDVQSEFRKLDVSGSTSVNSTEINTFIEQADAFINAKLYDYYVTPITGVESLKIIKMICVWLVADRISNILRMSKGTEASKKDGTYSSYKKQAMNMIDDIQKDKLKLTDASAKGDSSPTSFAVQNDIDPIIERDTDQW